MTNQEIRDAAVAHLKKTTTGYLKSNGGEKPPPWPAGSTHWGPAMDLLSQITDGTAPDPPPPPPANEPVPIAGQGYKLMFADDFTEFNTDFWRPGAWYIPESPANYSCANSVLRIVNKASERKPRDAMTRDWSFTYGYAEARMRYAKDTDSWASHWNMSDRWIRSGSCTPPNTVCEIDALESFHNLESPTTWRSHSSTIHRNTSGPCGVADEFRPNWTNDCGLTLADQWRTYWFRWTATELSTGVDDKTLKTWPTYDSTRQAVRPFLGIWNHTYSRDVWCEIDWYRVWQKPVTTNLLSAARYAVSSRLAKSETQGPPSKRALRIASETEIP